MERVDARKSTGVSPLGPEALAAARPCRLGPAILSFATLEIEISGERRRVTPKSMLVLLALCRQAGETLSRDQLLDLIWPNDSPMPDVLNQAVRELRRTLGEESPSQSCIQTVPRVGYRLLTQPVPLDQATNAVGAAVAGPPPEVELRKPEPERTPVQGSWWANRWVAGVVVCLVGVLGTIFWQMLQGPSSTEALLPKAPQVELLTSSLLPERQPSLSPDGRWLAYVEFEGSDSRIVLMDTVSGQRRRVTQERQALLPRWSWDGLQLAYQSLQDGQCQVRLVRPMELPTPEPRNLGECSAEVHDPVTWARGDSGLWMARPFGKSAPQLVRRDLAGIDHPLEYARTPTDWDLDPEPSPDGQWLLFRRGTPPRSDFHLVSSKGGEVRRLTQRSGLFGRAAWRPDGSAVIVADGSTGQGRLLELDIASAEIRDLGIADADSPAIALKTGDLVFERLRRRFLVTEVALSDSVGLDRDAWTAGQVFSPSTGSNRSAVFAPDGVSIAFISNRTGSDQVWLRGADGGLRQLTDWPSAGLADLAWSDDGRQLSVARGDGSGNLQAVSFEPPPAQPLPIDAVRLLPIPDREFRNPRILAGGRWMVWLARDSQGWSPFVKKLDDTHEKSQPVAGLHGLEPTLQIDGETVYFTDPRRAEVIRVDPPYREARIVADNLSRWVPGRWRLAQGAIWYVWLDENKRRSILYKSPLPGPLRPEPVLDLGELYAHPIFSISPSGKRVLVQHLERDETDIGRWHHR